MKIKHTIEKEKKVKWTGRKVGSWHLIYFWAFFLVLEPWKGIRESHISNRHLTKARGQKHTSVLRVSLTDLRGDELNKGLTVAGKEV